MQQLKSIFLGVLTALGILLAVFLKGKSSGKAEERQEAKEKQFDSIKESIEIKTHVQKEVSSSSDSNVDSELLSKWVRKWLLHDCTTNLFGCCRSESFVTRNQNTDFSPQWNVGTKVFETYPTVSEHGLASWWCKRLTKVTTAKQMLAIAWTTFGSPVRDF